MDTKTARGNRGAWTEHNLFSFLTLTGEQSIRAAEIGLSNDGGVELRDMAARWSLEAGQSNAAVLQYNERRTDRLAELQKKVRAHEGYRLLNEFAEFNRILHEARQLAASNARFAGDVGEIRLVRVVANLVGGFDQGYRPRHATLADQRLTHSATGKLLARLLPGAQLADAFESSELRRLLLKLQTELSKQIKAAERRKGRPFRADKDAAQRYWLGGLARELIRTFGEAPPSIVQSVAAMLDYYPDDSTIGRYLARARTYVQREHSRR